MAKLTARFGGHRNANGSQVLTEDEVRRLAPSVYAEGAHESRSQRYTYIPTSHILRGLMDNGFAPTFAIQGRCRIDGKEAFTKHMIRLRHADQMARAKDDVNDIIMVNSHDGTSSYQMIAGCFRFVCTNSLVTGNVISDIRVKHSGNVRDEVIAGAFQILDSFDALDSEKDAFKALQLSDGEERAYARAALALRFGTDAPPPVDEADVLAARRHEDAGASLWQTFQRVQENVVRGGLWGRRRNGRRTTTRPVAAIDGNIALNRGLWILAEEMRRLRVAA